MTIPLLIFYIFAAVTVASAVMVVASRNSVHSVLFLILAFVSSAGLFVLIGAEFLAMVLIVVYVGAVAVLFMFVVMMLDINFVRMREGYLNYLPVGALIGVILLAELVLIASTWAMMPEIMPTVPILPKDQVSNTEALGRVLYTDYVYLFQTAGLILLVAIIGAITLTLRQREQVRRQDIARQVHTTAREAIEMRKVKTGERRMIALPVPLGHYLTLAAILFTIGVFGIFLNRKNVIVILMSIELILLSININFVAFSAHLGDLVGQVFTMFILTVAAGEAAIGLAIVVVYFRNRGSIEVDDINLMKG